MNKKVIIAGVVIALLIVAGAVAFVMLQPQYEVQEFEGFSMEVPKGEVFTKHPNSTSADAFTINRWDNADEDITIFKIEMYLFKDMAKELVLSTLELSENDRLDTDIQNTDLYTYENSKGNTEYVFMSEKMDGLIVVSSDNQDNAEHMIKSYIRK